MQIDPFNLFANSLSFPWMLEASCRNMDPDIWFPELPNGHSMDKEAREKYDREVELALAICNGCPVKEDCLEYAYDTKTYDGIFGGTEGKERRKNAKNR